MLDGDHALAVFVLHIISERQDAEMLPQVARTRMLCIG